MKGGEYMNKNVIISIILIVVVGAAAFYGGMKYEGSKMSTGQSAMMGGQGGGYGRRFGGGQGGTQNSGAVRGKITSVSANSVTVQSMDGTSKIILFSNSTNISKSATGSASDLTSGTQVMAVGTTNSDGSVTAQLIQINPTAMMRGMRGTTGSPQPQ